MLALQPGAYMLGLRAHLLHQPRTLDRRRETGIVLDVGRDHQLPAWLEAGEQQRAQHRASGVNRGGIAGGARPDDDKPLVSGIRDGQ
jgi:hypothetical protein